MNIIKRLYGFWCFFWFLTIFFMVFPFMFLFLQNKKWYEGAHNMNRVWAFFVFHLCFIPINIERRFNLNKSKAYIYCPNHTSYMDIPLLYHAIKNKLTFVAKSSLSKVPLFGYMYKRLQINVDRKSIKSKVDTYKKAEEAINDNRSIIIFPEGTIPAHDAPNMTRFKDGPFRIAIGKQIPIVPVTIPFNWIILPDNKMLSPTWHKVKIIFHEPIPTTGLTMEDVDTLKEKTFKVIEEELKKQNKLS